MKEFNKNDFKIAFESGDLTALEYLEDTIISEARERIKENNKKCSTKFIREEYICSLFNSVMELNNCIVIHERGDVINNFNYDIYATVRDKLFEELGVLKCLR